MILDVDGVSFAYRGRPVLERVRFAARAGEVVAIMGPNGVGKTTLLKSLNRILKPHRGTVLVDGDRLDGLPSFEVARRIAYVSQRTEQARLTAFDAILLGRRPHIRWNATEHDLRMVDAAIKTFGLEHLALRHLDEMSGGELQKVSIARALVQEPRVLLLDEPTSSLDLKNQAEIVRIVRDVAHGHGVAVVLTMHDLNTALRLADRFLFLKGGGIHAGCDAASLTAGTIEAVYGLPVTLARVGGLPVVVPCDDAETSHAPHSHHDKTERICA